VGAPRFVDTTRDKPPSSATNEPADPVFVIAHHPSLARVGDSFVLRDPSVELSRLAPAFTPFASTTSATATPIDDPFVSRSAITLRPMIPRSPA